LRKKNYYFFFFNALSLFPSIYFGEIANVLPIFITLTLYQLIIREKISILYFLKISSLFFSIFLILITTQKFFILNYGQSASSRIVITSYSGLFHLSTNITPNKLSRNYLNDDIYIEQIYSKKLENAFKTPFPTYSFINSQYQRSMNRISELKNSYALASSCVFYNKFSWIS
jgi:hypothetical protein